MPVSNKLRESKVSSINLRLALAGALCIIFTIFYFISQSWGKMLVASTDILFVIVSGGCAAVGGLMVRTWGLRGKFGYVYTGLFLGVVLWFLGEATWAIYEVLLKVPVPYPSVADVFYLAGYLPAAAGMVGFMLFFGRNLSRRKALLGSILGLAIVVVIFIAILSPVYSERPIC